MAITKQDALDYHQGTRPGKVEVVSTKPCYTQRDLSLAYTPGVAEPCLEIEKNPQDAFKYTAKGNLVAVVTNGTAVLGLGDIGALAGKPVMEGKGVLFKRFADIDVFDIELNTKDADEIIKACQLLEPTFGGINLEDIKAPECFYIEETLKKTMKIPVFHDDQHGTAIISGAALANAVELTGKRLDQIKVVVNGAGASGIACAEHYVCMGVKRENITLVDTKGVIYKGRKEGMNPYKERFAKETAARTLADAVKGADCLLGLSKKGAFTPAMIASLAPRPVVFAMANPDPEISYEEARAVRDDIIVATGRSDYPNQVNNVLGFPFIFRGALDVHATTINEEMKLAATYALAALAKEDVPDSVCRAYGVECLKFGVDYIIPKPFDPRVLVWEAAAVAKAAMETGVAQNPVNIAEYREQLEKRLGKAHELMRTMIHKAQANPKRVVFPEGNHQKILRACHVLIEEKIAVPILLGRTNEIQRKAAEMGIPLAGVTIIEPETAPRRQEYVNELYRLRQRRGVTLGAADELMNDRNIFGSMMVRMGDADAIVSGVTQNYPDTIRPALQVIGVREGLHKVSGVYIVITRKGGLYFLADATVNIEPTAEDLAEIALSTAQEARRFDVEPRVAMLSFSSFGSTKHPLCEKVRRAAELARYADPTLMIDGEVQAHIAVSGKKLEAAFPFSALKGGANVLIFPDLQSCNIACKLLGPIGGAEVVGPILVGMAKPVHLLQRGVEVEEIVNIATIAVVDAQDCAMPVSTRVAAAVASVG
ncbi:MAG TPA: NADP-dependent malic enzyme [Terriglobales bacterium]|jgi:malate dehydrogenase (oxaloacetate-decarboxylating)(NADP+)|nr:NADP-dependent malic enzyme [Terriglobales bacterium]